MSDRTNDETQQQSRLIRVPVKDLRPGMYVHDLGVHWGMHPFLHNQFELDQGAVEKVRALGVKRIVVDLLRSKPSAFRALSAGNEDRAVAEEEVYAGDPGEITRAARQVIRSLLADARAGKALDMQLVKEASRELSKALTHHRNTMLALGRIRSRDGYTYQHSVNCGVLFMAFAKYLDMPTEKVRMLGTAGMLHDIGKAFVPEQILTKPSKLSDEEYKTIQTHPAKGGELLRNTDGVHPLVIQVAEQHHERMNGSGYPCRLEQKHLRLEVRMASIIDVYDAITAVRSYHQGRPPTEGLGIILKQAGTAFDKHLAQCFIHCIGVYPPGSLVRLTMDRLAIVLEPREGQPYRPLVRVTHDTRRGRELRRPYLLDLAKATADQRIERYENPANWFVRPEHYLPHPVR